MSYQNGYEARSLQQRERNNLKRKYVNRRNKKVLGEVVSHSEESESRGEAEVSRATNSNTDGPARRGKAKVSKQVRRTRGMEMELGCEDDDEEDYGVVLKPAIRSAAQLEGGQGPPPSVLGPPAPVEEMDFAIMYSRQAGLHPRRGSFRISSYMYMYSLDAFTTPLKSSSMRK